MTHRYDLSDVEYCGARAAFEEAIRLAGGQKKLAELCGCTQGNISQLVVKGSLLPSRFAPKVEAGLGLPREQLRPDVFGSAPGAHCPPRDELQLTPSANQVACNPCPILPKVPAND